MKFGTTTVFALGVLWASPAAAWDFTCSPREVRDLSAQTPNVMLMLDRSGSMADEDGELPNTCKVCLDGSTGLREVGSAADCPTSGTPFSVSDSATYGGNGSGYTHSFSLAIPTPAADFALDVGIQGDFGGSCEWADVYVDGSLVGQLTGLPQCAGSPTIRTFTVPAALGADGQIDVEIVTSADGNDCNGSPAACVAAGNCDGVDSFCDDNVASVRAYRAGQRYLGTLTQDDPCGSQDKWEQAVSAIDALTAQSDAASPEYAHFGLGLYHGDTTAYTAIDCGSGNHTPIMDFLGGESPGSSTPTARAIRTSLNSSCVTPATTITRTQSADVGTDPSNHGWDLSFPFSNVPFEDVTVEVEVQGDFNGSCEFAAVYVDGDYFARLGVTDCDSSSRVSFNVPASYALDGALDIFIDTRATADATSAPLPVCNPGDEGVDAQCAASNGAIVNITHTNTSPPPSATILVNDGAPTRTYAGGDDAATSRDDAVTEACGHRARAPLYVVGLGAGTDVDYNNVLAAAGGTGQCLDSSGNPVDPCDAPTNWESLDGRCSGSIQADSRDELLAALEAITASLACTFNINFFNSGYTSVPEDPASDYEYLYVDVFDMRVGAAQRVMHKDSSAAPVPGEGWEFTSSDRKFIKFTETYCADVRAFQYSEGSTQLACLCQEDTGAACAVPDNVALGVCPDGVWRCAEGVDYCEPEPECCEAGAACDTGLLGECAAGTIVCDGPPQGTCVPNNEPTAEVCDSLDNDCDGEVDEDLGGEQCTVPGGTGRCGEGILECVNGALTCSALGAMPELCNGLDDDCDGSVDNMVRSWGRPAFAGIRGSLQSNGRAAACGFQDVCMCPDGATATHEGENFAQYLAAYAPPVCFCGEGLDTASADGPMSIGEPSGDAPAACSTSGGASGTLASLIVLGLLALRRRR